MHSIALYQYAFADTYGNCDQVIRDMLALVVREGFEGYLDIRTTKTVSKDMPWAKVSVECALRHKGANPSFHSCISLPVDPETVAAFFAEINLDTDTTKADLKAV